MIFEPLPLAGAYLLHLERIEDDRGYNARAYCEREFAEHGLPTRMVQTNIISNKLKGTLRGMHFQAPPLGDAKLFRVTRGAIHDVIVDLRPESPTFLQTHAVRLRASDGVMLFVPVSFGQGFQTLEDDTELTYQVSEFHTPAAGRGFRYDDPMFGIEWPLEVTTISAKDLSWPDYEVNR